LLVIVYSYLLGSIPTAYIFARLIFKFDIRIQGSGNVGTLNFFRISHSKIISILVLIIDALKGYLALGLTSNFSNSTLMFIASVAVILGHIFPIWLGGKGGRGLATLAGVILYLNPLLVGYWWLLFGPLYLVSKKYIFAGILALFLVNLIVVFTQNQDIFLILSVNSLVVLLKYVGRLASEMNLKSKEGD
ncbi:MAG: glycerol-3-phosphate acyltransferase, partial [bacterium]